MRTALLLAAAAMSVNVPAVPASAQATPIARMSNDESYAAFVAEASQRFGIPVTWLRAVMRVESRANRRAISPKGAMGLMQIMPETWAELRARYGLGRDPFDPRDNVLAGAAFLREMYDRYGSPGFLAAYNAGPGRYEDYRDRSRPLPSETVAYVAQLLPLIGGDDPAMPVLAATPEAPAWTQAPLFIARLDDAGKAAPVASNAPSTGTPRPVSVRDMSAIAPQSRGLFVAVSTTGRAQ
ncbi:lytic transglycosylase domain-containing protein [Phenylobacterium sp.]|uniref:lytic transglycosylase domain-containing protein n=1 Tax=Phenylobacterium sp. TaxID=1871053 RepID=UPI0035B16970